VNGDVTKTVTENVRTLVVAKIAWNMLGSEGYKLSSRLLAKNLTATRYVFFFGEGLDEPTKWNALVGVPRVHQVPRDCQ
jgi:hypothetical protein